MNSTVLLDSLLVRIPNAAEAMNGELTVPPGADAIVVMPSIGLRGDPTHRALTERLHDETLATLNFDLLATEEAAADEGADELRFNIGLLAERMQRTAAWLRHSQDTADLRLGVLASGTPAAAALVVAARHPEWIKALVLYAARLDLAAECLPRVQAPTLLAAASRHHELLRIHREALAALNCAKSLEVLSGSRPFEENADEFARLAGEWFGQYLTAPEHAGST